MHQFGRLLSSFLKSDDGPTAVEYAVMLALIIAVCLVAINALGNNADEVFEEATAPLQTTGS